MKPSLRTFLGFVRKELKQTLRDPRMRIFLFLVPLIQLTLFTVALSSEIKNVRLAVLATPSDSDLLDIYQHALGSKYFLPATVEGNDPYRWIENNQADAVLVADRQGLTNSVARGGGDLQLLIDAKSVLKAAAIENYIKAIVSQRLFEQLHLTPVGLKFDVRALFNPTLETSVFMIPGLICMLACIVTILLTSMSIAKEREVGTLETLIAAPLKSWEILLGKTVPFVLLGCIQIPLIVTLAVVVFKIPIRGSLLLLGIASLIFVINTVSIGTLISTISKTQQQAMMGGFIFLLPSVLMSGLLFPIESMPWILRAMAWINPLSHYIALLRNLMVKGTSLEFFFMHLIPLILVASLCATTAIRKFHTTL